MTLSRLSDLDFTDKRVTVLGLGIEGVDLVRFLARQGASLTVSDSKPKEKLADRLREIEGLPVKLSLGSNDPQDIAGSEALFVSQSVPLALPALAEARKRGVPMHSMLGLFMQLSPGPVVGITGSSGKTTTTALVAKMFEAEERPYLLGGNIGRGLLDALDTVRPYTWSVLEVSHTQLQLVSRSPHVAAVLNITPNHLDRFSWDEYRRLKAKILTFQEAGDTAVLNYDDPESRSLAKQAHGRVFWFSMTGRVPGDGVVVKDGWATVRFRKLDRKLFPLSDVRLRGRHNQANAVAAAAIATACGISPEAVACAVESFQGVPHRLEEIGAADDVLYVNDSIATTPERTLAGLRSFEQPVVLLLGGRDKELPLEDLARESASGGCRAVIFFGESAGKLEAAFNKSRGSARLLRVENLQQAVDAARGLAKAGDVVLLSPSCTSYDAYENFEKRGDHFRSLVEKMMKVGEEVRPSLT